MERGWYGVTGIADHCGVDRRTVNGWIRDYPDFPAITFPGFTRKKMKTEDVDEWLRAHNEKEPARQR